jgi:hypothetical protein
MELAVRNYFYPRFPAKNSKKQQKNRTIRAVFLFTIGGPDGPHRHSYNPTMHVIPPGLSLEEAFAMVKKLQNA